MLKDFYSAFNHAMGSFSHIEWLFLSGGVDSATILAYCLERKIKLSCITFRVDGKDNADTIISQEMCSVAGYPHIIVDIPCSDKAIQTDVQRIMSIIGTSRKTHVQCSIPFLYMGIELQRRKVRNILWGMGAEWGTTKEAAFVRMRKGEAGLRQYRRDSLYADNDSDVSIRKVLTIFGIEVYDPWIEPVFAEWFLMQTYKDMHEEYQKCLAIKAYLSFWRKGRWRRKNANLQLISGIRDNHENWARRMGCASCVAAYRRLCDKN